MQIVLTNTNKVVLFPESMNDLFERIWQKKFAFLAAFFIIFTVTYGVLFVFDLLPEPPAENETPVDTETTLDEIDDEEQLVEDVEETEETVVVTAEFPVKITIERLGKEIAVLNPTSRTIADLDAALLEGVVRHPDSATLSQEGNVFILGHSSYLPNVLNRNFQAFNGIQNLEWGDVITLTSEDAVFEYRVEKVYRAKAADLTVPIAGTGKMLTLATCNSFGSVDDRYIVEAKQVSAKTL